MIQFSAWFLWQHLAGELEDGWTGVHQPLEHAGSRHQSFKLENHPKIESLNYCQSPLPVIFIYSTNGVTYWRITGISGQNCTATIQKKIGIVIKHCTNLLTIQKIVSFNNMSTISTRMAISFDNISYMISILYPYYMDAMALFVAFWARTRRRFSKSPGASAMRPSIRWSRRARWRCDGFLMWALSIIMYIRIICVYLRIYIGIYLYMIYIYTYYVYIYIFMYIHKP
jgi:hypothetical protein